MERRYIMAQTANISSVKVERNARAERSAYVKLLISMFKIGLIGFGGGSALIPVIEEEVVDEQHLISKKDYDEEVAAACVTPGALPVEIAAGVGRKTYGIKGMILSSLLMALPGAALTVLILSLLSGNSGTSLNLIRFISVGLGGFISCLLANYALKTVKEAEAEGRRNLIASVIIMAAVFVLTGMKSLLELLGFKNAAGHFIKLSTFQILMLSFAVMIAVYAVKKTAAKRQNSMLGPDAHHNRVSSESYISILKETAAWVVFAAVLMIPALIFADDGIRYILNGTASSFMSFGGGDAYLSVADGLFVNSGMVGENDFYGILVPVANALPGSILTKILTGTGYLIGTEQAGARTGMALAAAGFAISVAASGLIFGIVYWIFRTFENAPFFRMVSRWIRPIISGLLLGVMVTMFKTNVNTASELGYGGAAALIVTAIIAAADLYLINRKKTGNMIPMIASAGAGALLLAII